MTPGISDERACAFCGRTPLTQEHVWPQWIAKALGASEPVRYERRALGESLRTWERVGIEVTVRRVCAVCNNGWLSALEGDVKPVLEPLILGQSATLRGAEIETVAIWCVKTAFLFSFTHPERRQAPDDHYRALYTGRKPPPNTFVWLGGYDGTRWSGWYMHQILGLRHPGEPDRGDRGYCVTVTAGALVLQVIGVESIEPIDIEKASEKEPYIRQVWPKGSDAVELPPPLMLNDNSLPQFADPFGADNIGDLLA